MKHLLTICFFVALVPVFAQQNTTSTQQRTTQQRATTTAAPQRTTTPTAQRTAARGSISGYIIDAFDKTPIIGAAVIVDTVSGTGATTNEKGFFTLNNISLNRETKLYIYNMGYADLVFPVTPNKANYSITNPIEMQSNLRIEAVVLGTAPIAEVKGDTTQFNAGAYKTNPDATAGDLIAKMPGFKRNDDGTVSQQGEAVTKVLVDGKNYFRDDVAAALAALPAEIVQNIQLIDDKSDETKFTGYDDGTRIKTINIVTKLKSKTAYMGEYAAGYGFSAAPAVYDESTGKKEKGVVSNPFIFMANTNMFMGKNTLTLGFGGNNINQDPINQRGYYGGRRNGIRTAYGVNLNFNREIKDGSLSFTYTYNYGNSDRITGSTKTYSDSDGQITTSLDSTNTISQTHRANLYYEQKLGNNRIISRPSFSYTETLTDSKGFGSTEYKNAPLLSTSYENKSNSKSISYAINPNIMWFHNFNEKNFLTTSLRAGFSDSNTDQFLLSDIKKIVNEVEVDSISNQYIKNLAVSKSIDGRVGFTRRVGSVSAISVNYGLSYNWSDSDRKTWVWDPITQSYKDINEALSNTFNRDYLTNSIGLGYTFNNTKGAIFNVGVNYQNDQLQNNRTFPEPPLKENYTFNSPMVMASFRYNISKSKNFRIMFFSRSNLPSITQLQDVLNVTDPLNVSIGNPNLNQAYMTNLNFNYNSSNLEKSQSLSLYGRVSNTQNAFVTQRTRVNEPITIKGIVIQPGAQISTTVNRDGRWSASTGANYAFPLKAIKSNLNLDLSYNFNRTPAVYNGDEYFSLSNGTEFRATLSSNISSNLDFTVSSTTEYQHTTTTQVNTGAKATPNIISQRVSFRMDWIFWRGFFLNIDYRMNYDYVSTNKAAVPVQNILNASIGKKFLNNALELRLSGFDVLGQFRSYSVDVNGNVTTQSFSNNLQRYFAISLRYKFNTFAGGAAPKAAGSQNRMMGPGGGYGGGQGGGFRGHE